MLLSFQVERQFIAAAGIAGAVLPAIAGGAAAVAVINSNQDGLAQPLTELVGDKIQFLSIKFTNIHCWLTLLARHYI